MMTLHFLNDVANELYQHKNRKMRHFAGLKSETIGKLINRIPGSRVLISSLPGRRWECLSNRTASLAMSTSHLEALPGRLHIKRQSPSILYISANLAMLTSHLKDLPGKLDIKRNSPSILYISASLAMSTSVLKALPDKIDIKRHSPSILYISASLAMSTSVLKALPGKIDIKRHSPSILYLWHNQGLYVVAHLCFNSDFTYEI